MMVENNDFETEHLDHFQTAPPQRNGFCAPATKRIVEIKATLRVSCDR
jgi:hypothetical protein